MASTGAPLCHPSTHTPRIHDTHTHTRSSVRSHASAAWLYACAPVPAPESPPHTHLLTHTPTHPHTHYDMHTHTPTYKDNSASNRAGRPLRGAHRVCHSHHVSQDASSMGSAATYTHGCLTGPAARDDGDTICARPAGAGTTSSPMTAPAPAHHPLTPGPDARPTAHPTTAARRDEA